MATKITTENTFGHTDVTGVILNAGDKVAMFYQQEMRLGEVIGFTSKQIVVNVCDGVSCIDGRASLKTVKTYPNRIAKVSNQDTALTAYFCAKGALDYQYC